MRDRFWERTFFADHAPPARGAAAGEVAAVLLAGSPVAAGVRVAGASHLFGEGPRPGSGGAGGGGRGGGHRGGGRGPAAGVGPTGGAGTAGRHGDGRGQCGGGFGRGRR